MTFSDTSLMICVQNFFTNVKARTVQAGARGHSADGKHHFDEPEKALAAGYVAGLDAPVVDVEWSIGCMMLSGTFEQRYAIPSTHL